jgi:sugar lactone lactonase YvrE
MIFTNYRVTDRDRKRGRISVNRTRISSLVMLLGLAATPVRGQTVLTFNPAAGELPVSITFDRFANAWISLEPICEVRSYDADWQESARLKRISNCSAGAGLESVAFDSRGELYFAAIGPDEVRGVYVMQRSGGVQRLPGTEQIGWPNGLAFAQKDDTLYVTDMIGGAVWRIPRRTSDDQEGDSDRGPAELWINDPLLQGVNAWPGGPPLGANGIVVDGDSVVVSVSFHPRVVRVPINDDGSARQPQVLADTAALFAAHVFALDDIALDVHGNVFASVISPAGVARVSSDGQTITRVAAAAEGITAAVTSLAFGTRGENRKALYVVTNPAFGGTGASVVRFDAGVPGRGLP